MRGAGLNPIVDFFIYEHIARIFINSVKQAALKALDLRVDLELSGNQSLLRLTSAKCVELRWVPGHSGSYGNDEKADRLARGGSLTPFVGPEPVREVSLPC